MDPTILEATCKIGYVRPLTTINITNYIFADKNTDFIISIIKTTKSVEDVFIGLEIEVTKFLERFMEQYKNNAIIFDHFCDFLYLHTKNLKLTRDRVLLTTFYIKQCETKLVNYNTEYLSYKITKIATTEGLNKLSAKAVKFI